MPKPCPRYRLFNQDCLEVVSDLEPKSIDTVICDPPYGLNFMGKQWDHGVPGMLFWARIRKVCKPGALLLAFGGTRTYHRLACAIEDGGWQIRDCMLWLYGSGFPKSYDLSKGLDADAGAEREVVGMKHAGMKEVNSTFAPSYQREQGYRPKWDKDDTPGGLNVPVTAPATDLAKQWQGYGSALKPAHEIILCAQKPLQKSKIRGRIVGNLLQLEAQLWSLLPAKIAVKTFELSPAKYNEVCASARWSADERSNIRADLFGQTDTSRFVLVMTTILSIVSSWRSILAESCEQAKTSTTSTETGLIIDWKTLNSCLSALTPRSIIQAELQEPGSKLNAVPAARYLNAACMSIAATRELSVLGSAISKGRTSLPEDLGMVPNWEPIIIAMKPFRGTFVDNALAYAVAGFNIDAGRIGTDRLENPYKGKPSKGWGHSVGGQTGTNPVSGRWPANLILSHHPECVQVGTKKVKGSHHATGVWSASEQTEGISARDRECVFASGHKGSQEKQQGYTDADGLETVEAWECHEDCPVRMLDLQSGIQKSGVAVQRHGGGQALFGGIAKGKNTIGKREDAGFGDTGGASRFFYCAKASRRERDDGLEGLESKSGGSLTGRKPGSAGAQASAYAGTTEAPRKNLHPTVKPLAIMEYLCRLTRPPSGGVVFDPFMGSGTTGVACANTKRKFIGCEIDTEHGYFKIARCRIKKAYQGE